MWKPHRKILNYSFGYSGIRGKVLFFKEQVDRTLEELSKDPEKDLFEQLALCNVGMIMSTLTGSNFDPHCQKVLNLMAAVSDTLQVIAGICFRPWMFGTYHLPWSKFAKSIRSRREAMEKLLLPIIERRSRELKEMTEEEIARLPKTVLNQMVSNLVNGNLTYEEVRDELSFNIFVGLESIATLTKCALIHLAMYPDVQEKLVEELRTVFVSPNMDVDFECLKQLKFLDRVIKESLRLLSLVPFIARKTTGDVPLSE